MVDMQTCKNIIKKDDDHCDSDNAETLMTMEQELCKQDRETKCNDVEDTVAMQRIRRRRINVQYRFVPFFLFSFLLFCSLWAKTLCFEGESPGGKTMKICEKVRKSEKFWNDFAL